METRPGSLKRPRSRQSDHVDYSSGSSSLEEQIDHGISLVKRASLSHASSPAASPYASSSLLKQSHPTVSTSNASSSNTNTSSNGSSGEDRGGDSSRSSSNHHCKKNNHHHHHEKQQPRTSSSSGSSGEDNPCRTQSQKSDTPSHLIDQNINTSSGALSANQAIQQQEKATKASGQEQPSTDSAAPLRKQLQHHHYHRHHPHHRSKSHSNTAPVTSSSGAHHPAYPAATSSPLRRTTSTSTRTPASDGHGLPVPTDATVEPHASVIAHLPPPLASSSDQGGISSGSEQQGPLVEPHKEPGFHKIQSTFKRLSRKTTTPQNTTNVKNLLLATKKKKKRPTEDAPSKASTAVVANKKSKNHMKKPKEPEQLSSSSGDSSGEDNSGQDCNNEGNSSGSGTEGGYAGSASSNDHAAKGGSASSTSPSDESSEDLQPSRGKRRSASKNNSKSDVRPLLSRQDESNLSMSSDIADFSSGATDSKMAETIQALNRDVNGDADSITSCSNDASSASSDNEDGRKTHPFPRGLQVTTEDMTGTRNAGSGKTSNVGASHTLLSSKNMSLSSSGNPLHKRKPHILAVGSDVMAHVLTFLEPPEILSVLTMPLSHDWINTFTRQSELWRVLCLVEPFKAQVEDEEEISSDDDGDATYGGFPGMNVETELKLRFGKFRMLYTSFVRCMRYLARIKDDAMNGRPPSVIDYGRGGGGEATTNHAMSNQNLQSFLARARLAARAQAPHPEESLSESSSDDEGETVAAAAAVPVKSEPIGVSDDGSTSTSSVKKPHKKRVAPQDTILPDSKPAAVNPPKRRKKTTYGSSMITRRLLLPAATGETSNREMPWSCAIYSIVNWMVGFSDVEGIQTMCLKVLPSLLEDEQQRITSQQAGLTDVVLRNMVLFPDSPQLHTAAFHTIVLLARPLGGREGMLFHTSMVNSSGIFNGSDNSGGNAADTAARKRGSSVSNGKNGIAIMLDSMRRFSNDEVLQAMSCWSLVNIALSPVQKGVLINLGGIEVTTNAMIAHPYSAEVQFRALFALINLVIPRVDGTPPEGQQAAPAANAAGQVEQVAGVARSASEEDDSSTSKEVLDDLVEQIVQLVVRAMNTFCSSEAILNRACLVLHNLSLRQEYHHALLWTPNCYQMLEWCMSNYRSDQVLQQSAAGTLHRLQLTLSSDDVLRRRFNAALAAEQQTSLEQAHREAMMLHEQYTNVAPIAGDDDSQIG